MYLPTQPTSRLQNSIIRNDIITGVPSYLSLIVQYVPMKYSRETDELIFLYLCFVHRYFNQDHGKTITQKKSNALVHLVGIGSILQPSLCVESRLSAQPFVLQYRPVVTKGNQGTLGTCSTALLSCARAEKLKDFLYLRQAYR